MSGEWKIGLFGCFKDVRLCVVTLILPCYTMGRIAQHFGEDCVTWGLLSCIGCNPGVVLRWRLREQKKLNGTMMKDVSDALSLDIACESGSLRCLFIVLYAHCTF
jgi:Cys-rich protein (TIGR01571 family)